MGLLAVTYGCPTPGAICPEPGRVLYRGQVGSDAVFTRFLWLL